MNEYNEYADATAAGAAYAQRHYPDVAPFPIIEREGRLAARAAVRVDPHRQEAAYMVAFLRGWITEHQRLRAESGQGR